MKKITIKDIAKQAGVSPGAVSLVLNQRPSRISQEKKDLIIEIAKRNHYQPNSIARSMVTQKTNTLGVIIPDIENIFFSSLVKVLETHCHERGYALMIVNSDDSFSKELELLDMLSTRCVDGIFMTPASQSFLHREAAVRMLSRVSVPVVLLDRVFEELSCDKVVFDDRKGAFDAVCHLILMGHRRIGCVMVDAPSDYGRARYQGYQDALEQHGIALDEDLFAYGDFRLQSGYEAAKVLAPRTTAVFCTNDMMALGYLKYLGEQKIAVPDAYSIVGYDDVINAYLINLEFTSVAQDVRKIGEEASRVMFERLASKEKPWEYVSLKPELTVRDSVLPLHALQEST